MMAPRVFGIAATEAPVIAIIRRGPSEWSQICAWRLDSDTLKPGAWFRGTIYPQKCDLSPDGRWLVYSAMKEPGAWPAGSVYEAVSRLPWLSALAAWGSGTTYTRGLHFSPLGEDPGEPDVGDAATLLRRYGLKWTEPIQFAVERRRGWVESADTVDRTEGGAWDDRRDVTMQKAQPGGSATLGVSGAYAAFRTAHPGDVGYTINGKELPDVQWADWDRNGDLLVATTEGLLERRRAGSDVVVADLAEMRPNPKPAPEWASRW